ncbi:Saccharopine dehydrogenase-domain-containing protein [Chytriomyces sp. MP71]|nr:Saccharopine dehydrogenase-domain-containing protein [Chytriomyces sp. MP71]
MAPTPRPFDIVVFGATGFTGKLAAEYLLGHAPQSAKLALAGRNKTKLEQVRADIAASLPEGQARARAENVPILVADSSDQESLDAVVQAAKVILTTVGPFMLYGKPLVDSCVRFGTHYIDSTGETPFIKELIDAYHKEAAAKNVKIVPSCGCDSLPSDLGAYLVADHFAKQGKKTASIRAVVTKISGGLSGGTIHTIANMFESSSFAKLAKANDPYLITPKSEAALPPAESVVLKYNKDLSRYEALWFMAGGNSNYVRRSWGLLGRAYGPDFQYTESLGTLSSFPAALATVVGMVATLLAILFPPTRALIKRLFPQGQGPSQETMDKGHIEMKFVGTAVDGSKAVGRFASPHMDIGYKGTGLLLAESAMCLAFDDEKLREGSAGEVGIFGVKKGGVLTAATSMGLVLAERLKKAGMEIEMLNN